MERKNYKVESEAKSLTPITVNLRGAEVTLNPIRVDRGNAVGDVYFTPAFARVSDVEMALGAQAIEYINALLKRVAKSVSDEIDETITRFDSEEYLAAWIKGWVEATEEMDSAETGKTAKGGINEEIKAIQDKITAINTWMADTFKGGLAGKENELVKLPQMTQDLAQLQIDLSGKQAEKADKLAKLAAKRAEKKAKEGSVPTPTEEPKN